MLIVSKYVTILLSDSIWGESDLIKVNCFARSEFSLIKFCAELCIESAVKTYIFLKKTLPNCAKIMKKAPVLQVLPLKRTPLPTTKPPPPPQKNNHDNNCP